jgi:hypothetical protein
MKSKLALAAGLIVAALSAQRLVTKKADTGDIGRFQLVAGTASLPGDQLEHTLIRIDTETGRAWRYTWVPSSLERNASLKAYWVEIPEGTKPAQ